jgi:hypothetical protein
MSEQVLTRAIIEAANGTRLVHVWRNQSGKARVRGGYMQLAPAGSPDVIGYSLIGARFIGLEVKLPGEKATSIQETWISEIAKAGGIAAVVWSVDDALAAIRGAS